MALTKRTRFEVLRRDGHRCRYCGDTAEAGATLTVDHVVPIALGGTDEPTNLVAACRDCNAGKSSTSPTDALVADVQSDALRWRRAMVVATAQLAAEGAEREQYTRDFIEAWRVWNEGLELLPHDWQASVARWCDKGLPIAVLVESVDIAMGARVPAARVFRYLCGVVGNRMARLEELARESFEAEGED